MKSLLKVFENKDFGKIRVIEIDGEPWFVGKDVCGIFGDKNHIRSLSRIEAEDKAEKRITDSMGRRQQVIIVNESGLYALLFNMQPQKAHNNGLDGGVKDEYPIKKQQRLDKLRRFKRWVTSEVLPSIRKHGAYITDDSLCRIDEDDGYIDILISRLRDEKGKNMELLNKVEVMAPKARYYDIIMQCENAIQVSIIAKDYGMTASVFNKLLHGLRIQFKIGDTWVLYKDHNDKGYTVTRTFHVSDRCSRIHTYWTQKGRLFLYDILSRYGILPATEKFVCALNGGGCDYR
jgi:prophage antirepressor-like protein